MPYDVTNALVALGSALAIGFYLTIIARKLHTPAIVFLLSGGVICGPEIANLVRPEDLGEFLPLIVHLAVALILFEGGMTLNLKDYLGSSREIRRLLTIGVLVTWFGTAFLLHGIMAIPLPYALLAASLVIVTGPTVILPIIRRIRLEPRVNNILHWESVLIDAIGVFIAILCYEWVVVGTQGQAVANFIFRIGVGLLIGISGAYLLCRSIRARVVPGRSVNAFALATAIMIFTITEAFIKEAGILAVTVAGLYMGWNRPARLKDIKQFKEEISDLLIGLLFMLLAARLEFGQFIEFGMLGLLAVACVIFLIRPLAVFLSTAGSSLTMRQKLFLSWLGPKGIVAASMASLFSLELQKRSLDVVDPRFLETFTYSVICSTVILQGFSAGFVARMLGLRQPEPNGWLIVGANRFSADLSRDLAEEWKMPVVVMDTNARLIKNIQSNHVKAIRGDAMETDDWAHLMMEHRIGHLLALTDNAELNALLCQRWKEHFGEGHVFGWQPRDSSAAPVQGGELAGTGIWNHLPRPSVVSSEMLHHESELLSVEPGESHSTPSGQLLPLFTIQKKKIEPVTSVKLNKETKALVLKRTTGFLRRALKRGKILKMEATSQQNLYEQIVQEAVKIEPRLEVDHILEELEAEEKILPPYLGHGVSVPHIYSQNIDTRLCLLIQMQGEGLKLQGLDEHILLVFFIISPAGDPEGHLTTLAEVARICSEESFREYALREPITLEELIVQCSV